MLATRNMSSRGSGGNKPLMRSASMLLPLPGGPDINRLCCPAAATQSARFASAWPRTSARSSAECLRPEPLGRLDARERC
jgi:hypothetical protein